MLGEGNRQCTFNAEGHCQQSITELHIPEEYETEGRSKVTVSDEDTEPLIELTAALQKSTTGYGNGRAD